MVKEAGRIQENIYEHNFCFLFIFLRWFLYIALAVPDLDM